MRDADDAVRGTTHPAKDLGRAVGGSLLFATPMLMTLELWWLAASMDAVRVLALVAATTALLVALAQLSGFNDVEGETLGDFVVDAGVAVLVGTVVSAVLLAAFGVLDVDLGAATVARRVALGAVPASVGAMFARSQLTDQESDVASGDVDGYLQELVVMVAGAVIVAFNVAPTEEIAVIAFQAGQVGVAAVMAVSLVAMHGLVYSVGFVGSHEASPWKLARFTLTGYVLVVLASAFLLWVFGRADGVGPPIFARQVVVLSLPGAIGAAVGRLVL